MATKLLFRKYIILTKVFKLMHIVSTICCRVSAARPKLPSPLYSPKIQRNSVATSSDRLCVKVRWSAPICKTQGYSSSPITKVYRGGHQRTEVLYGESKEMSQDIKEEVETIFHNYHRVIIAVGANMGDRFTNLMKGVAMLRETTQKDVSCDMKKLNDDPLIRVIGTSFLRETPPMYVKEQPSFLNGAMEIETKLSPHALLRRLKYVEAHIGRNLDGMRNGPRPIDLDIIYYSIGNDEREKVSSIVNGGMIIQSKNLEIPHPRMSEREFVLSPLCDLGPGIRHPSMKLSSRELLDSVNNSYTNNKLSADQQPVATQVLPLPRNRMLSFNETHIMGILNVTPDSFSDGGNYEGSVDLAVEQALKMEADGASIIDIGGESTRPGAKEVEIDVELERTIPVIRQIRKVSDIPISIDTRHAEVAKAAVEAGADIVNDVSGGTHDHSMLQTVSKLQVPMILMHMRGNPETMQRMTQYNNVVTEVSSTLLQLSKKAEEAGIPRWLQVLDPGIGFAKDLEQNISLLKNVNQIRELVNRCPLLLGPSRKGFIGAITSETVAENRDFGTLAACLAGLQCKDGKLPPTILRVHNVKAMKQGLQIYEAILKAN